MFKNIIANFFGRIWGVLSTFLFVPIYINYLGFENYSIISFTLIIAGIMAIFDSGLTSTLSREFARSDISFNEKIRTLKTLESTFFILICIVIILILSMSDFLASDWLNLNKINSNRASYFLKIISFEIGFQLFFRFYLGGLIGLDKQILANFFQVIWGIIRNGIVILILFNWPSLEVFLIWQAITTIVFTIFIRKSLYKTLTKTNIISFKFQFEKSVFKRVSRFTGGILLITLVASLNTQIDKLVISKLLPIENLGYYTLALSIGMIILVLINPISTALLPRFTKLYSIGNNEEASNLFFKVNSLVAILIFSSMSILSLFSKEILWVWTGKINLANHVHTLVPIIVFSYSMLALQVMPFNIAIANGYTKLNNLLGIASLFITIPGYWIATNNFGSIGAAYVFCFVQTFTNLFYFYFINKLFLKRKNILLIFLYQMLFPLLISLCIAYIFTFMPKVITSNKVNTMLWIIVASIFTLFGTILILIPKDEIRYTFSFLNILKKTNN